MTGSRRAALPTMSSSRSTLTAAMAAAQLIGCEE